MLIINGSFSRTSDAPRFCKFGISHLEDAIVLDMGARVFCSTNQLLVGSYNVELLNQQLSPISLSIKVAILSHTRTNNSSFIGELRIVSILPSRYVSNDLVSQVSVSGQNFGHSDSINCTYSSFSNELSGVSNCRFVTQILCICEFQPALPFELKKLHVN
jgi:hypothetical protein